MRICVTPVNSSWGLLCNVILNTIHVPTTKPSVKAFVFLKEKPYSVRYCDNMTFLSSLRFTQLLIMNNVTIMIMSGYTYDYHEQLVFEHFSLSLSFSS